MYKYNFINTTKAWNKPIDMCELMDNPTMDYLAWEKPTDMCQMIDNPTMDYLGTMF